MRGHLLAKHKEDEYVLPKSDCCFALVRLLILKYFPVWKYDIATDRPSQYIN